MDTPRAAGLYHFWRGADAELAVDGCRESDVLVCGGIDCVMSVAPFEAADEARVKDRSFVEPIRPRERLFEVGTLAADTSQVDTFGVITFGFSSALNGLAGLCRVPGLSEYPRSGIRSCESEGSLRWMHADSAIRTQRSSTDIPGITIEPRGISTRMSSCHTKSFRAKSRPSRASIGASRTAIRAVEATSLKLTIRCVFSPSASTAPGMTIGLKVPALFRVSETYTGV
mmetsp:Transcript_13042/g.35099  ORF Transcript_13042/g.35099 Transcript_13042/m.35099 type:complete len:228 (-) Transcript_13042:603-1286(-)